MISSIFSAISALLGIPQLIALWSARRQGRSDQKLADDEATIKDAETARKVDASVSADSDSAVDAKLRDFARKQ